MSTKEDKFYINYNYLQLDKYLIEAEKIKDPIKKVDFWKDLLIKYEKDLNELKSENLTFETQIYLNPEYRYKKGSLLSADFKTLCKNQIEQIESFIDLKTRKDPATKKSVYNNLAEVWFFGFKQGNENKILNLDNWETYKKEFYSFKMNSYEDKYTLDEKKELERLKLAKIESKDPDFDILKKRYLKYLNEVDDNQETKGKKVTKFDPKQFNEDGAKLFEYLVENYIDLDKQYGLKKRFTNVWHFMKNDNNKKNTYKFYFTKNEYKLYVFTKYDLKITNEDKTENKYNEVDLIQLRDHVLAFEDFEKKRNK